MVASVKGYLRKTLGKARLTFNKLSTLLTEIESTLNLRPLTYDYNKVEEEVLTPSNLIYGRRLKTLTAEVDEPDDAMNPNSLSARFTYLTTRQTHFWKRWQKEYLASLRKFHKCNAKVKERVATLGEAVVGTRMTKNEGSGKWALWRV